MKFNCRKVGCRKAFFSREELREHIRVDHRPATAPVLEAAKPRAASETELFGRDYLISSSPGRIKSTSAGPFVFVIADKGLVVTHSSGDSVIMSWALLQGGLQK